MNDELAVFKRLNLKRHPILRAIYDAVQAIEECGASTKLTDAVCATTRLSEMAATLLDERDAARARVTEMEEAYAALGRENKAVNDRGKRAEAERDAARALFERGCYNLMLMMQAYERRVRSDCTTPEQISARPWECAEYVEASRYLRKVWPIDAALKEPPNVR